MKTIAALLIETNLNAGQEKWSSTHIQTESLNRATLAIIQKKHVTKEDLFFIFYFIFLNELTKEDYYCVELLVSLNRKVYGNALWIIHET